MIDVLNEQRLVRIQKKRIERLIRFVLNKEKRPRKRIAVLITDNRRMRHYHKKYLNDASATDVMSFETGDIVISAEYAKSVCAKYSATVREEIERYAVHGLLHLLGYDDQKKTDYSKMHAKQEAYLNAFAIKEKRC